MLDSVQLRELIAEYDQLRRLEGYTPQSRGQRFNELIASMLRCWGIDASVSVRAAGEIDVAFTAGGTRYLVEAKWEKKKADTGDIAKLQRRVKQRIAGTVGLFIAVAGYSSEALSEVATGERLEVLLLDQQHFESMLSGLCPPQELLNLLRDRAAFRGEAYTRLQELLKAPVASLPDVVFPPHEDLDRNIARRAREGVSVRPLFIIPRSNQMGITSGNGQKILATTASGIIEVDPLRKRVVWAVQIQNCHGKPLLASDGSITFTRRHGIAKMHPGGQLTILGGGYSGATHLIEHPSASTWVLDNGELGGTPSPSVTQLGSALGEETQFSLNYPPSTATNAAWLDENTLAVVGGSFLISNPVSGTGRELAPIQSNPMGIVALDAATILTAGDSVSLYVTDLTTGNRAELAQLALNPSVNDLTKGTEGNFYISSYCDHAEKMSFMVAEITVPHAGSEFVKSVFKKENYDKSLPPAETVEDLKKKIEHLRERSRTVKEETQIERQTRIYNEHIQAVHRLIFLPLQEVLNSLGLQPDHSIHVQPAGWPPVDFGGSANQEYWGIDTFRSPKLAISIGLVHRSQPVQDLTDFGVTIIIAQTTVQNQYDYINVFERFSGEGAIPNQLIENLRTKIGAELPKIVEDFIAACENFGILAD